ncbi:MAG: DNA-binding response regulator [Bacteroidetes bacterium]|nr:MAG: DNA-binding response regulator [Bacteroidota bacterium]
MKVLIVEYEAELLANLTDYLGQEGFVCEQADAFHAAVEKIAAFDYDIVVLDLMLPDGNGLELLRQLKQDFPETGVLIVSAKNALDDKLAGFELGADDYLTKPFHLPELVARLRALYRRRKFEGQPVVRFEELSLYPESREARVHDELIDLTQKEYDLLDYLLANRDRVLTKQAIAEHLWGDYVDLYDSFDFVYQHIKNLRKKLSKAGAGNYIRTVYSLGYSFKTSAS